jgi:GTPase SAR1 family protein
LFKVKSWIKELKRMLGNDVVLCIVGNKIDLEKDRHVSVQTAEDYAKSVNAKLYHTSAKLNKGVEELFSDLAQRKLVNRKKVIKIFSSLFRYASKSPIDSRYSQCRWSWSIRWCSYPSCSSTKSK